MNIIYGTEECPWCHRAKEFLKSMKVKFRYIDVGSSQKAAKEMIKKSGQMAVPVLDIKGHIIVGYDKGAIKKALNLR